jgi:hypothetical protein
MSRRTGKMKNGFCPHCNSTEVYRGLVSEGEGLTAGSYTLSIELFTGSTQKTLWVDTYICRACGYIEMHVVNCEDLAALPEADGWEKVTPS